MTCPGCRAPLLAGATLCVHCGLALAAMGEPPPDPSGLTAEAETRTVPPTAPATATATAAAAAPSSAPAPAPASATAPATPAPPALALPIAAKHPLLPRLRRLGISAAVLVAAGAVVALLFSPLIRAFTTTYPMPRISIQTGSDTAGLGMLVQFTASVAAGRDLTFTWTFSDGQTADGNPVSHAFQQHGQQSAHVVATDPIGQTAQAERSITVLPPAPHAVFQVTTSYTVASFDASSSTGDNLTYSWDFGDGTTSSTTTSLIQHDYRSSCRASTCTYTVALRVVDAAGQSDVFQSPVTASAR